MWTSTTNTHNPPQRFWINWLYAGAAGVMAFGLALVLAPALARQGFSLLIYSAPGQFDAFGTEPARYVALAHAVIGGVMVGWGVALLYVIRSLFAKGRSEGWYAIAISIATWYVPDTAYSIFSGFWQNAVLNTVFLVVFAVPLWATRQITQ